MSGQNVFVKKLKLKFTHLPYRWKVFLLFCSLYSFLILTFVGVIYYLVYNAFERELTSKAKIIASVLSKTSKLNIIEKNFAALDDTISSLASAPETQTISYIYLLDSNNELLAIYSRDGKYPNTTIILRLPRPQNRKIQDRIEGTKSIKQISLPLKVKNIPYAYLHIGFNYSDFLDDVKDAQQWLALLGIVGFVIFPILIFRGSSFLITPLKKIEKGVSDLRKGIYGAQIEVVSNDEFKILAETFNDMSLSIQDNIIALEMKQKNLEALSEIGLIISSTLNINKLSNSILTQLQNSVKFTEGFTAVPLKLDDNEKFIISSTIGMSDNASLKIEEKILLYLETLKSSSPVFIRFISDTELLLPFYRDKSLLGYVYLKGISIMDEANKKGSEFFKTLSTQISTAIQNSLNYEDAIRDSLTGLYVQNIFRKQMADIINASIPVSKVVGIVILDIDFFKKINDTYGHQTGDAVLKGLANIIKENTSSDDVLCRYGGEEFGLIIPRATRNEIKIVCEKIRGAVESSIFESNGTQIKCTVTIGFSLFPNDASTVFDLIEIADKSLYSGKNNGRNRVCPT